MKYLVLVAAIFVASLTSSVAVAQHRGGYCQPRYEFDPFHQAPQPRLHTKKAVHKHRRG